MGKRKSDDTRSQKSESMCVDVILSFEDANVRTKSGNIYIIPLYEYALYIYKMTYRCWLLVHSEFDSTMVNLGDLKISIQLHV